MGKSTFEFVIFILYLNLAKKVIQAIKGKRQGQQNKHKVHQYIKDKDTTIISIINNSHRENTLNANIAKILT